MIAPIGTAANTGASAADGPIVVIGAGAAGMACALSAAGHGADVLLVERARTIGGTVADALIHTIGGLFDDTGAPLNAGLPLELVERLRHADGRTRARRIGRTRVLNVDPAVYRQVARTWIGEQPRIRVLTDAQIAAVTLAGNRVGGLSLRRGDRTEHCRPAALVDASGDAACVRRIDPALVAPGAALAGLVAVIGGVAPGALEFPKGVALIKAIRTAVAEGRLPAACATLWPDSGIGDDEVYVKLNLAADAFDPTEMDASLDRLLTWLRDLPAFAGAHLRQRGQLGVRDGGRIRGRACLTEADLKAGRRFADAVCQGCWPIEHWHPERGIQLDYLPPGTRYDIPLGALQVAGLHGVYAAGKCLSAEPRAQASARVAGTCWGMGAGLGSVLAAT